MREPTAAFIKTIETTYGSKGKVWLNDLHNVTSRLMGSWGLQAHEVLPDLSFNFVQFVELPTGEKAVLKLGPHLRGRLKEAAALRAYSNHGVARLLNFDESCGALLIERVVPGTTLESKFSLGQNQIATSIAFELIKRLHQGVALNANASDFTNVEIWGLGFEKFLREGRNTSLIPQAMIEKADSIFKSLAKSSESEILLHGDLHHFNILEAEGGWLAIDPKGVWGDPAFEVGAFLRNPSPQLSEHINLDRLLNERVELAQSILGFDKERVVGWAFAQSVLAAIWSLNDNQSDYGHWLKTALSFQNIADDLRLF